MVPFGLAGVVHFWIVPEDPALPVDYSVEFRYESPGEFRERPRDPWQQRELIAWWVETTVAWSGDPRVIQGDLHWSLSAGEPFYESTALFGVDRHTRVNLSGYGNRERSGQFLFPHHVERRSYRLGNRPTQDRSRQDSSARIKGIAPSFGLGSVGAIGAGLERAAEAQEIAAIGNLLDRLADYLSRVEVQD